MEILNEFKRNGYFTSTLYHLVAQKKIMAPETEIIPSTYIQEMKMTTQARLQRLSTIEISNLVSSEDKDQKHVLEFTPRIIVFQNFTGNGKYVAKFNVKNKSTMMTNVNMVFKQSSQFSIKSCGADLLSRLAPGLGVTLAVTFTPTRHEDYAHRVTFNTPKQQYVVPLIAMGPRTIFDFPDQIIVPSTPLKVENSLAQIIHNISTIPASFTCSTKCPFSVQAGYGHNVQPKENVEIKVLFKSMHLGELVGKLTVTFETGEIFAIKLRGTTYAVSIELDKAVVRFKDTYNTMACQQEIKIVNKSDQTLSYMCMKNNSIYKDFEDKIKLATIFYDVKEGEAAKYQKLIHYDVTSSSEHERVYTRIFFNEVQSLVADESLLFSDLHFSIMPNRGKLWPNETIKITATFAPREIGDFVVTAFLDIDGISDRVPLTMQGTSLPPNIHLHLENLDMDNVYINKTYRYEIVALNKGHIAGVIQYKEVPSLFGSVISCTPETYCLSPGDKEVFIVSFLNSNQGPYFEELNFVIRDTNIVRKLYLKGTVVYPTITFSIPCLDFGNVNVGVPKILQVDIINESEVNVNGTVKISSDGPEVSSVTLEDCEACDDVDSIFKISPWPKEFNIDPTKLVMCAYSRVTIRVTLTANIIRTNETVLELEMEKSDSPPIKLPITYSAQVPTITPAADINLRACCLDSVCYYDVIVSSNEFWGYFVIEEPEEENTLQVNVGIKRGIIRPNTTISFPVTIMTPVLGLQEYTIRMHLFGMPNPIDICHITALGVRPIVTCYPISLNWGHLKLLTRVTKTLLLANDSPVTIYFKAGILNNDGKWSIQPEEGSIEPESETDLCVSLCLVDANTYYNKAVIHVEKVKDIFVPLTVVGVGTSIVVGKDRDHVDLGRHFVKLPLCVTVSLQNCGTRVHALEWSERYAKVMKNTELPPPFFNLEPRNIKIGAGETTELKITGLSHKVGFVKEMWYLIGSVEGINKKDLLMECEVSGEFVESKLILSAKEINLQYDYGPYSEFYKLTDILTIKNVSRLPVQIDINIRPPFAIVQRDTYKIDPEDEDMCCCITYDEADKKQQNVLQEAEERESPIFLDCITNKPLQRERQGPVHFFQDIRKLKLAFNFTNEIEQWLEDEEVMKLQIVFDISKHMNLRSKVYSDLMRIKLRGHKNKDAVTIVGKINFPNVAVSTPKVQFNCIMNATVESRRIQITNTTGLLVCYKFSWKKCSIAKLKMPEMPILEHNQRFSELKFATDEFPHSADVTQEILNVVDNTEQEQNFLEATESQLIVSSLKLVTPHDSEMEYKSMQQQCLKKIMPMLNMEKESEFNWAYKFRRERKRHHNVDINELFDLVPHKGHIAAGQTHIVHVIFRPLMNVSVNAVLECEVLGGPSEFITVNGQSSDLIYKLNMQTINFKIRSFHENATETLIITNMAQLVFEYKTYLNEPVFDNDLPAKIWRLVPPEKEVNAETEVSVDVVIRPGVIGYFKRTFLLEIGHLPHIPIDIFGWGVIPQVYFKLPRPKLTNLNVEIGYDAIATITLDYLAAVSEIFNKDCSEHLNTPLMNRCFEDPDFQEGWHICSAWDGYPSLMDIDLAIERSLVMKHIKSHPEIMNMYTAATKMASIPGFTTIPYLIDFGVVITGHTVTRVIEVINYGPIPVKLLFPKNFVSPNWLNIKLCPTISPGEMSKIEISFNPTSNAFPEVEHYVDLTFYLKIPCGVTIPFDMKALCAVPFLKSNIDILDLGAVRCGNKIIASVALTNVGKPMCVWYVTLKLNTPGPSAITVLVNSGKYEPGEGGWLSVAFKPTMEMVYEGKLIFHYYMNPNKMVIPVVGRGIFPHPHIIGPNVTFPPTMPWEDTTEAFFGITNPCPFPIELIIAHVDEKWKEEDQLYNLLYRYYNNSDEMLVPAVNPGDGMPKEVNEFFDRFKTNVKRTVEQEAIAASKLFAAKEKADKKKPKNPKSAKVKVDKQTSPVRKIRTEAEIISDEIMNMKEEGLDPIRESLKSMEEKPTPIDEYAKGLLLFFHGSPDEETYSKELACTLGIHLGIPVVNFDSCIVEALCASCITNCVAKTIIMTALDDNLEILRKAASVREAIDDEYQDLYSFGEHLDEFEIVMKKLELFLSNKGGIGPSPKNKNRQDVVGGGTLAVNKDISVFPMELIHELLTEFFEQEKFQNGFIMDSLTSNIVKMPPLVLTTVLKCKRKIHNIHLVLCHSDFSKWLKSYEAALREAELAEEKLHKVPVYTEEEVANIVRDFEDMDAEEYERADPDLKAIYIKNGLEERKRKCKEKQLLVNLTATTNVSKKTDKSIKDQSGTLQIVTSDPKKKGKKDDAKVAKNEVITYQSKYADYQKNVYDALLQISNNWVVEEAEMGFPLYALNGSLLVAGQKKSKKPQSSVALAQDAEEDTVSRGFPLTLVMCPCLQYKQTLVDMFKCPYIEKKLKPPEKINILELPVKRQEYTVLLPNIIPSVVENPPLQWRFLEEQPIKKCECNQITDLNLLDDTTQDNVLTILAKWHCVCGKKVASSQTSTTDVTTQYNTNNTNIEEEEEFYHQPLPLHAVSSVIKPQGRVILMPGDLMRCKYAFNPTFEGNFVIKRFVEVAGWPASRVDVNVSAICDLPRLDNRPKKMFANFVRRTQEDKIYKLTFLDDLKKFEFGPIFIGMNRIYEEEYTIELKNASLLVDDVIIEFMEPDDIFQIDKNFISLEPGCRGQLTVTAAPPRVGDHNTVLLFCIKNNPEIVTINISCSGVTPLVEILPLSKIIDYGKLLLYRREDDRFIVKNDSILPIMWKVKNPEDFVEDFIISKITGIIPRNENHVVPVTYIACNVSVISQLGLVIEIYDELGRGEPMVVETLLLSAECYDVTVECAFENPEESFLNFGNVKVNSTASRDMFLLNRGLYNIYYKLKKVKDFPEPSLLKSFSCNPDCGMIPPSLKLLAVEFECTPTTSINLSNVPAYTCSLLDGSKDQVVVAQFPVCVSIASFYNTFTLFPLGELNFHIIAIGVGVMREVILNNTSKCPFNYQIVVPEEYRVDPEHALPMPKDKESKLKNPPLKCGNFLIVNEDNLIAPGDSRTIQIQFLATAAHTFEEVIHFIVSDTCPAEAQGVPLKLVGTGAMPTLDFWNLDNTFREHLIVKNLSEYKIPESSPHCVFVEETVTLYFFCVTVNTSHSAKIDLYNNGLVPCILTMKLIYQTNTKEEIFSLDKYEMQIDPLMHRRLGITFAPKELQEYRAVLEIRLKLFSHQEQTFTLCLIGEGVIPRIRLIKPAIKQHRLALLSFPVTCLGSVGHKSLRFKNITTVNSIVTLEVMQAPAERPVFWMIPSEKCKLLDDTDADDSPQYLCLKLCLKPSEVAALLIYFSPLVKGRTNCDIKIKIQDNPYENYTVMCEAEGFVEDIVLIGLEMLSMDYDISADLTMTTGGDTRKKIKSASPDKKKAKDSKKTNGFPLGGESSEPSVLKYLLDFGGCELCSAQKRSVVMLNNSDKVYRFTWEELPNIVIAPAVGYISPGEEKDIQIMFLSAQPVAINRELIMCNLMAISNDVLSLDTKGATWDSRQIQTVFDYNKQTGQRERITQTVQEDPVPPNDDVLRFINIVILYSVTTEYTKYTSNLEEECNLKDTYIYQKRSFEFTVENVGTVPLKISWNFSIEDNYPTRIDRCPAKQETIAVTDCPNDPSISNRVDDKSMVTLQEEAGGSRETLFSGSLDRASVDTWCDTDLPFTIEPKRACLQPRESQTFKVTFAPMEVFNYTVRLRSSIDNLDPYDQNLSCKIVAKSLIPYVHLDIEESDYLWSGRRKNVTGIVLPPHMQVLEFNVLGTGCYKKTFKVINPTSEAYEFVFVPNLSEALGKSRLTSKDFSSVHCDPIKGYVEGGTALDVTFSFTPTSPGVYEAQWKFMINKYNLVLPLMVVGFVREPDVIFVPTILIMTNSLVGFTSIHHVKLKNNEDTAIPFEFKGDSLVNEDGKTIIVLRPRSGVLKPMSETGIAIYYTPIQDGPLSFKIFCQIAHMVKQLALCVNALSHLVKATVTYYLIGNEHKLDHDAVTNIHLEQTASTYERTIPFKIKNDGSTTFSFEWRYEVAKVKKYLTVRMEPRTGYIAAGAEQECVLHFNLRTVPVEAYPVTLTISNGPLFQIYLYAEIEKPLYHFSFREYDFGKCIINAPDRTYKKNLAFTNDDNVPITLDLTTENITEFYVDYRIDPTIQPKQRAKIPIYFRPKAIQQYEFKLQFWVNSLCEDILVLRGEGVPLLVDIYMGCQKCFNLGPVKVGENIIREIEVMNHSKVAIDCSFVFKEVYPVMPEPSNQDIESTGSSICLDPNTSGLKERPTNEPSRLQCVTMYKDEQKQKQIAMDIQNALASVKVVPSTAVIQPHRKIPLKIQFKPVGLISELNIQLDVKVLEMVRPLVLLSGSATGMSLCLSQRSLQFGRVRRRGCKALKVMLMNKGDFDAGFWWQPLVSEEFSISPMQGLIAAKVNVTFTVTFRPLNYNPFVKVWASLNIENYPSLDLALYAACMDVGVPQNQSLYIECPVRCKKTEYFIVTNPTDETWLVLSEFSEETPSFETLREFYIEANSTFEIPIRFKPNTLGTHEAQLLFSPLGESAMFVTLVGVALHPLPNGIIDFTVEAKKSYTEPLIVNNITEKPELYIVTTELIKVIPEKFEGYYEIKYPETVKVWGEAKGTCMWTFICFETCEMYLKVMFINEETREYQYYEVHAKVVPSQISGTIKFTCRARESVQQELTIKNPLTEDVVFNIVTHKLHCVSTVHVSRQSETQLTMTFSPLVVGEFEDSLTIENYLIGALVYRVICTCKPAKEKFLEYTTCLGKCVPIRLRVQNKSDLHATFISSVNHASIILDKNYELAAFAKGKFLVWFEPMQLGVQNIRVVFFSDVAGEFVYNIKGTATEPKPLGPVDVKAGSYAVINFKNVFEETRTFRVYVDREDFYVKTAMEQIKPKKEARILVYLTDKPDQGWADPPTGSLMIETFEPADPKVHWTYFLQGIP